MATYIKEDDPLFVQIKNNRHYQRKIIAERMAHHLEIDAKKIGTPLEDHLKHYFNDGDNNFPPGYLGHLNYDELKAAQYKFIEQMDDSDFNFLVKLWEKLPRMTTTNQEGPETQFVFEGILFDSEGDLVMIHYY